MTELWSRAGIEPTIEELLADPICRRIMLHDGISADDAWAAIRRAGRDRARAPSNAAPIRPASSLDYLTEARQMRDDWVARMISAGLTAIGRYVGRSVRAMPHHLRLLRGPELLSQA